MNKDGLDVSVELGSSAVRGAEHWMSAAKTHKYRVSSNASSVRKQKCKVVVYVVVGKAEDVFR